MSAGAPEDAARGAPAPDSPWHSRATLLCAVAAGVAWGLAWAHEEWAGAARCVVWGVASALVAWWWRVRSGWRAVGLLVAWVGVTTLLTLGVDGLARWVWFGATYTATAGPRFSDMLAAIVPAQAWLATAGLYLVVAAVWGRWRSGGTALVALAAVLWHITQAPVLDQWLDARRWGQTGTGAAPGDFFAAQGALALVQVLGVALVDAISASPDEGRRVASRYTGWLLAVLVAGDALGAAATHSWGSAAAGIVLAVFLLRGSRSG